MTLTQLQHRCTIFYDFRFCIEKDGCQNWILTNEELNFGAEGFQG